MFYDPFLIKSVFYGFILFTMYIFVVYLKYISHTSLWVIFKRFLFGELVIKGSVNFFKLKLLGFVVGFRTLFISYLNYFVTLHGTTVELNGVLYSIIAFVGGSICGSSIYSIYTEYYMGDYWWNIVWD